MMNDFKKYFTKHKFVVKNVKYVYLKNKNKCIKALTLPMHHQADNSFQMQE